MTTYKGENRRTLLQNADTKEKKSRVHIYSDSIIATSSTFASTNKKKLPIAIEMTYASHMNNTNLNFHVI